MRLCGFCGTNGHDAIDCPNVDRDTVGNIMEQTRIGLLRVEQAIHEIDDPHCTCNDCITRFEERQS